MVPVSFILSSRLPKEKEAVDDFNTAKEEGPEANEVFNKAQKAGSHPYTD